RVRYWQFDHKLMEETIAAGANTTLYFQTATATEGEDLEFTTGLEMHVLDVDITKDFEWHCAKLTAGAGLRYAKIAFDTDGRVYDGTDVVEWVESEHSFEGVGPTVFVNFKAPIRQSALSVVGGLRGSVLFGRGRGVGVVVDDVEETLYAELGNGNTTTGAIEGDLGLQYDRTLTNGVDGFVRVAWEGQLWFEVGSPTTDYGDMGMEGLSFSFGITR
ncbi:MAG TPA: Lpg1974 family pore-forming outer membrane protein, partial [Thermoguttaceae bacterium]|nr:Lpg1974 family pore-forming outer membrane protein [Thermoguttaceae bacterium]